MLYWIFDLDLTLYQLPSGVDFNYKHLNKDDQLNHLLSILPCEKLIFTNGTYNHAIISLGKIGISNKFKQITARDTINDLKPRFSSFKSFMNINGINKKDKCVFFDDQLDNIMASKKLGWITVLISPENIISDYIDFKFSNIHLALNYFLSKIHNA
jgi:putative hydrolase of the HAD superfamily